MKPLLNGSADKFLVSLLGAVSASLSIYWGTAKWEPVVIALLTALGTYFISNTPRQP